MGTFEQSDYRWSKIYGGIKVDQAKQYKDLELENTRLKKLVMDLLLREVMLKEVIKGKLLSLLGLKMPLRSEVIRMASTYGRYGYRFIASMVRNAGWGQATTAKVARI